LNPRLVYIIILSLLLTPFLGVSQQQNLPLNREFGLVNQKAFNSFGNNTHTSFLPIIQSFIKSDSLASLNQVEKDIYLINISKSNPKSRNFFKWIYQSAFFENFAVVDTGNFYLSIDPLLNGEFGKDSEFESDEQLYKNTRGLIIRANIGEKFSFQTSFYENQATYVPYIADFINNRAVAPGQGRVKPFKDNGFDFASASANISYTPTDFLNIQLGTGKNFIGEGYRSLLLSDQSHNYPFFKFTTQFGKKDQFQYIQINAQLTDLTRRELGSTGEALFQRKAMTTHYFSWNVSKWLNLGLFENTIWETEDTTGTKAFNWQQINPIFGLNTLSSTTDNNNSNLGLNTKIKLPFKLVLYNQVIYNTQENSSTNGYQVGFKYFGLSYFTFQAEYNAMNGTSPSFNTNLQNQGHYNEWLAHPFGSDFQELVGIMNFKYKRFFTQVKVNYATVKHGLTASSDIKTIQAHLGYLINPKNNLSAVIGVAKRDETIGGNSNLSNYVYFGIRTSLRNLYDDF
jgi:hypothetical protein